MSGAFVSNSRGFGFVTVEGLEQDLFIPPDKINGAFYGDTVEVKLLPTFDGNIVPGGKDGRRQEAEVIKILARGITKLVGTFERGRRSGIVTPDNKKIPYEIYINRQDTMGAVDGHKVVIEMTNYGSANRNPEGRVVEILGHIDDPGVDILSIIRAYDLPVVFPDEVQQEVQRYIPDHIEYNEKADARIRSNRYPAAIQKTREDWRKVPIVTIDGPDTKDIDDAISVETTPNGYRLGVHIADVSEYVREGSPLDQEALRRATSNYLVDRVIPMLPHELSNGICSLNQGEDRYALSCIMELDKNGAVTDSRIAETVIHSSAKLSYPGVMKLFTDHDDSEIRKALEMQGITEGKRGFETKLQKLDRLLRRGRRLAKLLEKRRDERGSIDFEFRESEIILDEKGRPVDIVEHERNEATQMIEDFMILANETVASTFYWLQLPFVYRTHGQPTGEKIDQLKEFIRAYGYQLKGASADIHPKEIRALLEKLKGRKEEAMISVMTLRSMQRAEYTTDCGGHFGLALKYYCHFTSPIRRYPDLQIHRIIKEYLRGQLDEKRKAHYNAILPNVCKQSSNMERRADEAERETDKQKKAEYMQERIGQEFDGVISGITGWGFYVELPNTVEGLVPIGELRDDYYIFDEKQYILYGQRTGRTFELGQKVRVLCAAADTVVRTIDFVLAGEEKSHAIDSARVAEQQRNADDRVSGHQGRSSGRKSGRRRADDRRGARQNRSSGRKSGRKQSVDERADASQNGSPKDFAENGKPKRLRPDGSAYIKHTGKPRRRGRGRNRNDDKS